MRRMSDARRRELAELAPAVGVDRRVDRHIASLHDDLHRHLRPSRSDALGAAGVRIVIGIAGRRARIARGGRSSRRATRRRHRPAARRSRRRCRRADRASRVAVGIHAASRRPRVAAPRLRPGGPRRRPTTDARTGATERARRGPRAWRRWSRRRPRRSTPPAGDRVAGPRPRTRVRRCARRRERPVWCSSPTWRSTERHGRCVAVATAAASTSAWSNPRCDGAPRFVGAHVTTSTSALGERAGHLGGEPGEGRVRFRYFARATSSRTTPV